MLRVKNEADFLRGSVESILPLVDEVVVIDNASTDETRSIVLALQAEHPAKVFLYDYPHDVARVGVENLRLTQSAVGRRSPNLLSNYYNWCLRRCTMPFVLKWDGDMVAVPELVGQLRQFRNSRDLFLMIWGANIHPDCKHFIAAAKVQQDEIQKKMPAPMTVENWTAPYTDAEIRLFPKWLSRYRNDFWWCESFYSPFMTWSDCCQRLKMPCYIHMKYCKQDPYGNFSRDLAEHVNTGVERGDALTPELQTVVDKLNQNRKRACVLPS